MHGINLKRIDQIKQYLPEPLSSETTYRTTQKNTLYENPLIIESEFKVNCNTEIHHDFKV